MKNNIAKNIENSLPSLLDEDHERVIKALQADRSQASAMKTLDKEIDRLMYRVPEVLKNDTDRGLAQSFLLTLKNALPLLESVSEVEVWDKRVSNNILSHSYHISDHSNHISGHLNKIFDTSSMAALFCGVIFLIAALIGYLAAGRSLGIVSLLFIFAGCVCMIIGGFLWGRGKRGDIGSWRGKAEISQVFLVDTEQVWHVLRGAVYTVDSNMRRMRERNRFHKGERKDAPLNMLGRDEIFFFSELLENAYASRRRSPNDVALQEQVDSICYYLHSRGIQIENYTGQNAKWFELLPSGLVPSEASSQGDVSKDKFLSAGVISGKDISHESASEGTSQYGTLGISETGGNERSSVKCYVTIRPAMLYDGEVIRMGIASA